MTDIVFTAINKHKQDGVKPPALTNNAQDIYYSYFESGIVDQWLFVFDFTLGKGPLYGGDTDWEPADASRERPPYFMDHAEAAWYAACWMAVEARELLRRHGTI